MLPEITISNIKRYIADGPDVVPVHVPLQHVALHGQHGLHGGGDAAAARSSLQPRVQHCSRHKWNWKFHGQYTIFATICNVTAVIHNRAFSCRISDRNDFLEREMPHFSLRVSQLEMKELIVVSKTWILMIILFRKFNGICYFNLYS